MNTRIIGIDPGLSGGLAFSDGFGRNVVHSTKKTPPHDAAIDAIGECERVVCYIEDVPTFISAASKPVHAKLGRQFGLWEGLMLALRVRVVLVRPQVWQKSLPGMTTKKGQDRKRALRDEAARRFPGIKVTLDNCDALLIMDYGQRQERGAV